MSETETPQGQFHEVDISYSNEELINKLEQYEIAPNIAYSKVTINRSSLLLLKNELNRDSYLNRLCEFVDNWQSKTDASVFTRNVNQLIFLWINAIVADENTQVILDIFRCFV